MTNYSRLIVAIVGLFTIIIGALMIVFTKDGPIVTCLSCGQTGTSVIGGNFGRLGSCGSLLPDK